MTPQEKAEELITKFQQSRDYEGYNDVRDINAAIRCALIAVEEIKEQLISNISNDISTIHSIYWEKVKQEIENI